MSEVKTQNQRQMKTVTYTFKCGNRLYWLIEAEPQNTRAVHVRWDVSLYRSNCEYADKETKVAFTSFQGQYRDKPSLSDCVQAIAESFTALIVGFAAHGRTDANADTKPATRQKSNGWREVPRNGALPCEWRHRVRVLFSNGDEESGSAGGFKWDYRKAETGRVIMAWKYEPKKAKTPFTPCDEEGVPASEYPKAMKKPLAISKKKNLSLRIKP